MKGCGSFNAYGVEGPSSGRSSNSSQRSLAPAAPLHHIDVTDVRERGALFRQERAKQFLPELGRVPDVLRSHENEAFIPIRTNGDGACSLHAVFGVPTLNATTRVCGLKSEHARGIASKCAGSSLRRLREKVSTAALLNAVENSLWFELFVPTLKGQDSSEGRVFHTKLKQGNKQLYDSACVFYQEQLQQSWRAGQSRNRLRCKSREFFCPAHEMQFVRVLAQHCECLPFAAPAILDLSDDDFGRFYAEHAQYSEWLGPCVGNDGTIKGTRVVPPANCPRRKYEALFDTRAAFDAIRESFLLSAGSLGGMELLLGELACNEDVTAEGQAALKDFQKEIHLATLDSSEPSAMENFAENS